MKEDLVAVARDNIYKIVVVVIVLLALYIASTVNNDYNVASSPTEVHKKTVIKEVVHYIKVKATAYTAGFESTGKRKGEKGYGITASGTKVKEGRTIACPRNMKLGTKVYIKEFKKTFVCEDRGGAIQGKRIDIFIASLDKAVAFGKRDVNILVQQAP